MRQRSVALKLLAGAALIAGIGLAHPANAAPSTFETFAITVNTTMDTPPATPSNCLTGGTGTTCSLRQAIEAASTASAAGTFTTYNITVPAGTYTLQYGTLTISANTTNLLGAGAATTLVDGSGQDTRTSNFTITGGFSTLKNLTIENGGLSGSTDGGGVYVSGGEVALTSDVITANAAYAGGGVYNYNGNVTMNGTSVTNNTATSYAGGVYNDEYMTIYNGTITGNAATGPSGDGGGIYNEYLLQMTNTSVNNNIAGGTSAANALSNASGYGGGIYNEDYMQLTNGTVNNNTTGYEGGGILNYDVLHLTGTAISHNQSGEYGGGIYADDYTFMTSVNVTNNTAGGSVSGYNGYGGGDYNNDYEFVTNSNFTGNTALASSGIAGSAIHAQAAPVTSRTDPHGRVHTFRVTRHAVQSNAIGSGGQGGGLYDDYYSFITNSNYSGNTAYDGAGIYNNDSLLSTTNVSISGNSASDDGGGLYITGLPSYGYSYGYGTLLQNTRITSNTAGVQTGGVYNDTPADFYASDGTISGNTGGSCPNIYQPCGPSPAFPVYAITVNTPADTTPATPSNCLTGGTGTTCSLRQAIEAASTTATAGTYPTFNITVPANTYYLRYGSLVISRNTTNLLGYSAASTIVDGSTQTTATSDFSTTGGYSTLKYLTVRNGGLPGTTDGGGVSDSGGEAALTSDIITANNGAYGAGLYNYDGNVTVANTAITYNNATSEGGGVYADEFTTIYSSNVSSNLASGSGGEGGGVLNFDLLQMTNTIVNNNVAGGTTATDALNNDNGYGGGVYADDTTQITGGTINTNTAGYEGGGVYNRDYLAMNSVAIENNGAGEYGGGLYTDELNFSFGVTLAYNKVGNGYTGYGGGEYNGDYDFSTDSVFLANKALVGSFGPLAIHAQQIQAPNQVDAHGVVHAAPVHTNAIAPRLVSNGGEGGGLYVDGEYEMVTGSRFTGNGATDGAGIFDYYSLLNLTQVINSDNMATDDGGGVYIQSVPSYSNYSAFFQMTSITGNTASNVTGGVYNDTPADFYASDGTISNNHAPTCPNIFQPCV